MHTGILSSVLKFPNCNYDHKGLVLVYLLELQICYIRILLSKLMRIVPIKRTFICFFFPWRKACVLAKKFVFSDEERQNKIFYSFLNKIS